MRQNRLLEVCRGGHNLCLLWRKRQVLYDRGAEHWAALDSNNKESPLVEHQAEAHGGEKVDWKMSCVKFTKGNLHRQSLEAHLISNTKNINFLNRKGEWGQNLPPKLEINSEGRRNGPKRRRDDSPS